MGRRGTGKVRFDGLSQRQQRMIEKKKRKKDPRKDGRDWAGILLERIKEMGTDER